MPNAATQLQRVYTSFTKTPSQETLLRLYKVANRANRRLLLTWNTKWQDLSAVDRPLIDASYTKPTVTYEGGIDFFAEASEGDLYLAFNVFGGRGDDVPWWWTFNEINYALKVRVEDE